MERILITGGAGYIGSVLTSRCCDLGHHVVVLDDLSTGHREAVDPRARLVEGDLLQPGLVEHLCHKESLQCVIHLAGRSLVEEAEVQSSEYLKANTVGSMRVFEEAGRAQVQRVLMASTAAVYARSSSQVDHNVPSNVYGLSKSLAEQALEFCAIRYGFFGYALRLFNVGGAYLAPHRFLGEDHQPETHLIPTAIRRALCDEAIPIYGDCVRDYIHVVDVADAFLHVLDISHRLPPHHDRFTKRWGAILDVGLGQGLKTSDVVRRLAELLPVRVQMTYQDPRLGDVAELVAEPDLRVFPAGWPRYRIEDILYTALAWHREFPQGYATPEAKTEVAQPTEP